MRSLFLLGLLAARALAIAINCVNCTHALTNGVDFPRCPLIKGPAVGADTPPPKPRPAPPPPPPPSRPPRPELEPASDELWDKAGAKGCTLSWAMQAQDHDAGALYVPIRTTAASPITQESQLNDWFWLLYTQIDDTFHDLYATWGIGWALADLGISTYTTEYEGGLNHLVSFAHQSYEPGVPSVDQQWYEDPYGGWRRATGASFSFTVNTEEGIIIGLNRESPRWAAKDRVPPVEAAQLPELNQFSDVAWLMWRKMNGRKWRADDRTTDLRYFLSVSVTNTETRQILKRAHEANGWELEEWPGHTFEKGWEETKAIIGSPNIQGFAYLLNQHKAELGNMYLDKIQVFQGETKAELPCILVHVKQPRDQAAEVQVRSRRKGIVREHVFRAKL